MPPKLNLSLLQHIYTWVYIYIHTRTGTNYYLLPEMHIKRSMDSPDLLCSTTTGLPSVDSLCACDARSSSPAGSIFKNGEDLGKYLAASFLLWEKVRQSKNNILTYTSTQTGKEEKGVSSPCHHQNPNTGVAEKYAKKTLL